MNMLRDALEPGPPTVPDVVMVKPSQATEDPLAAVADAAEHSEAITLEVRPSPLDERPPPNLAMLRVQRGGDGSSSLVLDARSASPPGRFRVHGRPREGPSLALGEVARKSGMWPQDVVAEMHRFSQNNADACLWIAELRRAVGDLQLVIIDSTHFEIPWELLVLPADDPDGMTSYLGVAVSVARWPGDVIHIKTYMPIDLSLTPVTHRGQAIAWVDRKGLSSGGPEYATLERLRTRFSASVTDLRTRLGEQRDDVALVYVGAHGQHSKDTAAFAIGASAEDPRGLSLSDLAAMDLRLFRRSHAVVFLNVCHAGRAVDDPRLRADPAGAAGLLNPLRAFPESLIRQGAVGVIAATGEVNDDDAAEMAQWLLGRLAEAGGEDGLSVAELLRHWRRRVRDSLPESWNDWDQLHNRRLLTAGMYVYYGSPLARLCLGGPDGL